MERVLQRSRAGFTLLEIAISMAIFAVTLGAVAQGLAYSYGLVNLQNQRVTANNDCRAVIASLRLVASMLPDTTACPATANKFPCVLLDWSNRFPANAAAVAALSTEARKPFAGMYTLKNETITITLTAPDGTAVLNGTSASESTNPVHVAVTVQWTGPRKITYRELVRTALTNR